jgi:outer membrane lipoprotein SlyB
MPRILSSVSVAAVVMLLAGCAGDYSPNTYASNAVQLANKVESGTIVGYREVAISAKGNIGAVSGGAAGGILGAQYADSALVALGGSTVGAIVGNTLDHATGDTAGWEYIVRKMNGDMLSVTQREKKPLVLGQKVLVIMGPQARVIADYSVIPDVPLAPPAPEREKVEAKAPPQQQPVKVEVVLQLPPGVSAQQASQAVGQAAAQAVAAQATAQTAPPAPAPETTASLSTPVASTDAADKPADGADATSEDGSQPTQASTVSANSSEILGNPR